MRRSVGLLIVAAATAVLAPASQAKPNRQDGTFLRSASARALTEVDLATAVLHMRGSSRRARSLATLVTKRSGHESRVLIALSLKEGVAPVARGKRRAARQVAHLAKVSRRGRTRSFARLLRSDVRTHLQAYDTEIAKGHDAQVLRQARQWRARVADLLARAERMAAK